MTLSNAVFSRGHKCYGVVVVVIVVVVAVAVESVVVVVVVESVVDINAKMEY